MKRLIVIAGLMLISTSAVSAETVRTCSSIYGGGEVCGETTITSTPTHVVTATSVSSNDMVKLMLSLALAAGFATGLYKLTYRSYILG